METIEIIKLNNDAEIPKNFTEGSSGFDIRICIKNNLLIKPNKYKLVNTGISIYIKKKNITGLILPRSGLAYKKGLILKNTIGIIDSDYQGEILIPILNISKKKRILKNKDRIAQILFVPIILVKFKETKNFSKKTKRFKYGLGHSGIN